MSQGTAGPSVAISAPRGAWRDHLQRALEARQGGSWQWFAPESAATQEVPEASTLVWAQPPCWDPAVLDAARQRGPLASDELPPGVRHLVLISSTAVHAPSHHHAGLVSEQYRGAARKRNPIADAWRALEARAAELAAAADARLSILRPAPTPVPGAHDLVSRLLSGRNPGRWAVVPVGFDPTVQLLSLDDLAAALEALLERRVQRGQNGVYHVVPPVAVPLRQALRHAGSRRLPSPLQPRSADASDYLRHSWTAGGETLRRELGVEPAISSAEVARTFAGPRGDPQQNSAASPLPNRYDDFGMDPAYIGRLGKTLFRFLHDAWWRIEVAGLEHVPRSGRAVLAGVHRGHQPWDGVMMLHLLVRELQRYPRFLIHPTLVKFPFLAPYMLRCGGLHACRDNSARILENDGLLAIFPEGIRGAFTPYRDAYKLGRFGRDEFVKAALRHGAPIVPFVTVGSAEIFPIFGRIDWSWFKRFSEWPYLPITPTMGTVPLPSKWHTRFLQPVPVAEYFDAQGPAAADDAELVRQLSQEVRQRMEAAIAEMLERRKSIFFGSILDQAGA